MSYWTDKRVMVTGGGGFLGNHAVEKLRQAGCRHLFVVRSKEYDLTREPEVARLYADLAAGRDGWPAATAGAKGPVDIVVHLAGLVGGIGANKARSADFFYRNLMMGTLTLHYAWKMGAQKVVAAGAGCGYPEFAPMPQKETSFWDGFPQTDSAPYSLAKRMLQVQSLAYWRQHRFPIIVTIPGNIYGPHDNFDLENAHVVPALVRKFVEATEDGKDQIVVWGSGKPTRDFVYAGDVAAGLLRACEVYEDAQLVNLSSGRDHSIREVVRILGELTGFRGSIRWDAGKPEGQIQRVFDMTKARTELGFEAATALTEGLRRTVDWYKANRRTARNLEAIPGGAG
jgi:GDP-L-fucose synthase